MGRKKIQQQQLKNKKSIELFYKLMNRTTKIVFRENKTQNKKIYSCDAPHTHKHSHTHIYKHIHTRMEIMN